MWRCKGIPVLTFMSTGFDSIPPAAIFQHCLPDNFAPPLKSVGGGTPREICLDTPRLWTSIPFGETRSIELLKEWLSRAQHHPLTIYLDCSEETRVNMLLDVVKPYCLRWRDIHFVLPLLGLCQLNTSTFPCLERLALSTDLTCPLSFWIPCNQVVSGHLYIQAIDTSIGGPYAVLNILKEFKLKSQAHYYRQKNVAVQGYAIPSISACQGAFINCGRNIQHCLPDTSDHLWPSSLEAPLLLAQICRQWREICLDTPRLWASIAFGETRSIELLKEWLSRARRQPLTIYLDCGDETRAQMLVDVVKPYCLQWQDIHFALPLSAQRQLNTCTFPCLERLMISSTHAELSDQTTDPVIIRDAPLLREATIGAIPSLQVNLPMEKLAILYVAVMQISQIIAVLRRCPNIVDLTCVLTGGDHDVAPTPVELHALRSLASSDEILHWLTLPHLEQLDMGNVPYIQATTDGLHAFVSRSSCAPKLLIEVAVDQSSGASLMDALRGADVLPWLKRLEVDHSTMAGDPARLLLDMLAWRRTHSVLESFELIVTPMESRDVPTAAIIAEFRALGEAGLKVRIVTRKRGSPISPDVVLLDTLQPVSN
ncbi:hypothetical protein B0H13DRAFT_1927765 [Mycena leptocephala]|nr:hypothetical protein B0H13DRAFT_1927765 [Mycena leptocephala]